MIRSCFVAGLALIGLAGTAQANPTNWSFVETALYRAWPGLGTSGYQTYDVGSPLPLPFYAGDAASLTLSDTAFQRGTVAFDYVWNDTNGTFGHVVPGSDTDFAFNTLPIAGQFGAAVTLPYFNTCCGVSAHLALSVGGTLNGVIDFANWANDIHMVIADNIVSLAFIANDWETFGCPSQCFVSGYWVDPPSVPVPEPGSLLLVLALAGITVAAKRSSRLSLMSRLSA